MSKLPLTQHAEAERSVGATPRAHSLIYICMYVRVHDLHIVVSFVYVYVQAAPVYVNIDIHGGYVDFFLLALSLYIEKCDALCFRCPGCAMTASTRRPGSLTGTEGLPTLSACASPCRCPQTKGFGTCDLNTWMTP